MSDKPKYTPGPWKVRTHPQLESFVEAQAPDRPYNQEILGEDYWPEFNREADARLIAAAPELLEALRELEYWAQIPDDGSKTAVAIRDAARAAIAKALTP